MTIKIDELIQDIRSDEAPEIAGKLEEEQQRRIENIVLSAILPTSSDERRIHLVSSEETEEMNLHSASNIDKSKNSAQAEETQEIKLHSASDVKGYKKGKRNRRKLLSFLFAAALIIAIAMTAGAAVEHDWDVALMNFIGISDADTVQLSDANVRIDASSTCSGTDYGSDPAGEEKAVCITAVSSIGNKNAAYIRIDTDYELPEDFDPEQDYILPENVDLSVSTKKQNSALTASTKGYTFTSTVENGKLVFLLYISDCEKINKSYVSLTMADFYLYHDLNTADEKAEKKEPELIYAGSWSLNWKYSYRSIAKTKTILKSTTVNGVTYYITHLDISPLGIRWEGFVSPLDQSGFSTDDTILAIDCITFTDGRVLSVDGYSSSGSRNNFQLVGYTGIDVLGEVLDVEEIESITIGGCEITL